MAVAYIIYSEETDFYYKGSAENMELQLEEHNNGKVPYTKSGIPWKTVLLIEQPTLIEARKMEWQLKNILSREKLLAFIDRNTKGA